MAQQVKATAAKSNDLSPIPEICMVEGVDRLSKTVLGPPHVCHDIHVLTGTSTLINNYNFSERSPYHLGLVSASLLL